MGLNVEKPDILRITYKQEKGNRGCAESLRIDFEFDMNRWSMNARSLGEILCFKFGWIPERGRSFLEVCAETDGKKLYDKEYWLDFEEWKKKICDIWDEYIRPELKRICRGEVEI